MCGPASLHTSRDALTCAYHTQVFETCNSNAESDLHLLERENDRRPSRSVHDDGDTHRCATTFATGLQDCRADVHVIT